MTEIWMYAAIIIFGYGVLCTVPEMVRKALATSRRLNFAAYREMVAEAKTADAVFRIQETYGAFSSYEYRMDTWLFFGVVLLAPLLYVMVVFELKG